MDIRWTSGGHKMNFKYCQVNVKSHSDLDIVGHETCSEFQGLSLSFASLAIVAQSKRAKL